LIVDKAVSPDAHDLSTATVAEASASGDPLTSLMQGQSARSDPIESTALDIGLREDSGRSA
jgi:hypothetical protein